MGFYMDKYKISLNLQLSITNPKFSPQLNFLPFKNLLTRS